MKQPAAGRIYVWFYPDTTLGWHLTADAAGCAQLVAASSALATGRTPKTPPLPVAVATAEIVSVMGSRSRAQAVTTLQLVRSDEPRAFAIDHEQGALTVTVGGARIAELQEQIRHVDAGYGDFSMGPADERTRPNQRLWFWWMPDNYKGCDRPRRR